jgi:hypothetical protein
MGPFDLEIATSWDDRPSGPACGSGTSHILGPGSLLELEVLSADPWDVCFYCGCWRPQECLRPAFTYFESEEDRRLNEPTRMCRQNHDDGWTDPDCR